MLISQKEMQLIRIVLTMRKMKLISFLHIIEMWLDVLAQNGQII